MVSGFYESSSGTFLFRDRNITRYGTHRRAQMGIGCTFQNIRLFFGTMSAEKNVLSGMHTRLKGSILGAVLGLPGTRREERDARETARELLSFVGIRERRTFARNLSYTVLRY